MKKLLLIGAMVLSFIPVKADEGMWLMMLIQRLNHVDMQRQGLHLTPEEIYSVNQSSMKDAIVSFGGFCTGEIVSQRGLIFTNHHCGYDAVAGASTPSKNYLKDGFWAKNFKEEIPIPGLYVRFLVKMGDATQRINSKLTPAMTEEERKDIIFQQYKEIEKEFSENGKYTIVTKDFFNGNEFYYFVYQDYKDVRLAGAPPSSLGKYGGDTDNWEWPRHTADFSIFRVYADAAGKPAEYSAGNVPLKPKHSLPISMKGVAPGDFSMIVGYPGRTNRYLTSYGIKQLVEKDYPGWVEASKAAMDVMKKYMDKDETTRLSYASQYASVANYWKNRAGTIDAVLKNGTIDEKKKLEQEFNQWALLPGNQEYYGILDKIDAYYKQISERNRERNYAQILTRNAKYIPTTFGLGDLLMTYASQDVNGKIAMKPKVDKAIDDAFNNFNVALEGEMLRNLVELYQLKVSPEEANKTIANTNAAEIGNIAYSSIFATKTSVKEFILAPDKLKLDKDPFYIWVRDFVQNQKLRVEYYSKIDAGFQKNTRLFLQGMMKAFPNKKFYPDANSTMRLTYGKVDRLPVRNDRNYFGITDNFYTDMAGTIGKYKKGDEEFDLPARFIDLYNKKDFGPYADKKGYMPVNFLTNHDITGGNSGSPVIDGYGNLIGIAFDGNSEALSGDIVFEKDVQKTINADIRYILWIIDKYAGAKNLISELKLVK